MVRLDVTDTVFSWSFSRVGVNVSPPLDRAPTAGYGVRTASQSLGALIDTLAVMQPAIARR